MKKLFKGICAIVFVVVLVFTSLGYLEYRYALSDSSLEDKVSEIQSKDDYVVIEDISEYLLQATVSMEDQRFYKHDGIDFIAYGRIIYVFVTSGQISGGGSTITQQLAKNMYFGYEPSLIRKIAELFMSHDLEKKYSKDEILEIYVNIINYGDNHMGIYQASQGYFHKEPKKLSFNEATLLAGIPQSPSYYQLSNHADNAYKRQKAVINMLIETNIYTQEEVDKLMNEGV
ncbi:MAG: transglycosylase domain-containing protein [Traorella sp.]